MSHTPSSPRSRPPAVPVMRKLGLEPDPWQTEVLESAHPRLLLNCCRQAGKSTVVALLGLVEAIWVPGTRVILLSRSHRQSTELFRIVVDFYLRLGSPLLERRTAHEAVCSGRLICLSTPYGKRGFFHDAWACGGDDWLRIEVPAARIARIPPHFLEEERRALGESWFRQEYCCSFEAMEGLVYPDFARCVVPAVPVSLGGKQVGGIDFGFRNPFAAVWGTLDGDGVLWRTGEHYSRGKPLFRLNL